MKTFNRLLLWLQSVYGSAGSAQTSGEQGLPCWLGKDAPVSSLLLLLEVSGWKGITAFNYWGVFPWVCGGLCIFVYMISQ